MILIKTKEYLYNFNNIFNIYICGDKIEAIDTTNISDVVYFNDNKEILEKVYNIIQNEIIALNMKNESGCIDVDSIIEQVEGTKTA